MSISLKQLFKLHDEWKQLRPSLNGKSKQLFHIWVLATHPDARKIDRKELERFRQQCLDIQKTNTVSHERGIGQTVLKQYAQQLCELFLMQQKKGNISWEDFLNKVLKECKSERALRRYLKKYKEENST